MMSSILELLYKQSTVWICHSARLSRIDRQFYDGDVQKGSLPDSGGFTLTRSDSLMSFTVDLGPSLMTEVLSLIDNPSCLQASNHSQAAGEEEEGEDHSSLTETPVQSPELTSPNPSMSSRSFSSNMNNRGGSCSVDWAEQEEGGSLRTPDVHWVSSESGAGDGGRTVPEGG
ncbi:hypothetical protein EPR50_G00154490 [Perca flavescens]|uniref:Cdc42 effector-like domain-containing protein n=1 Tax=Perca flavescens TaxID=8167 RepID=A0A484CEU4_PERFV|nr:hypothetical protein EPR50_G00154490 [Perca flavescens]